MKNQDNTFNYFQIFLLSLSLTLPLIMVNTPVWLIAIVTFLMFSPALFGSVLYAVILYCIYDIIRPILYVWGLVVAIQGKQDLFTVVFYILVVLQAVDIVKRFIGTVSGLIFALTNKEE